MPNPWHASVPDSHDSKPDSDSHNSASPAVIIDNVARGVLELLARAEGGFDPNLVSVEKARKMLRRGMKPVARIVKAWKHEQATLAQTRLLVGKKDRQSSVGPRQQKASNTHPARNLLQLAVAAHPPQPEPKSLDSNFHSAKEPLDFPPDLREAAELAATQQIVPAQPTSAQVDYLHALEPLETPYEQKKAALVSERTRFTQFAISYLGIIGRPAVSAEIYDAALAGGYQPQISRRTALDELATTKHAAIDRLGRGYIWLVNRDLPSDFTIPKGYHSRRRFSEGASGNDGLHEPHRESIRVRRQQFVDFAFSHISALDRPLSAAQIYVAAKGRIELDFKQGRAREVLMAADDPRLQRLRDGRWWLVGREDVPPIICEPHMTCRSNIDFKKLGQEIVRILTARGAALTSPEIYARLSTEMMSEVSHSNGSE